MFTFSFILSSRSGNQRCYTDSLMAFLQKWQRVSDSNSKYLFSYGSLKLWEKIFGQISTRNFSITKLISLKLWTQANPFMYQLYWISNKSIFVFWLTNEWIKLNNFCFYYRNCIKIGISDGILHGFSSFRFNRF